jgi:hypothetical protein
MARWGTVNRFPMAALLLLAGCSPASHAREDAARIFALQDDDRERRDAAFQELLRANASIPSLRGALGVGAPFGFPVVALLYAQGRGDAVPLDLRALHLAGFEWPAATSSENGVVEPFVKLEVEQDLALIGRRAPGLGRALEGSAAAGKERGSRAMIRSRKPRAARESARLTRSAIRRPARARGGLALSLRGGESWRPDRCARRGARCSALVVGAGGDFPRTNGSREVARRSRQGKDSVLDLPVGRGRGSEGGWRGSATGGPRSRRGCPRSCFLRPADRARAGTTPTSFGPEEAT